jgi:transposase
LDPTHFQNEYIQEQENVAPEQRPGDDNIEIVQDHGRQIDEQFDQENSPEAVEAIELPHQEFEKRTQHEKHKTAKQEERDRIALQEQQTQKEKDLESKKTNKEFRKRYKKKKEEEAKQRQLAEEKEAGRETQMTTMMDAVMRLGLNRVFRRGT